MHCKHAVYCAYSCYAAYVTPTTTQLAHACSTMHCIRLVYYCSVPQISPPPPLGGLCIRGMQHFLSRLHPPSIEKCLAVLWMLASFLCSHSTMKTYLEPNCIGVRRGGRRGGPSAELKALPCVELEGC